MTLSGIRWAPYVPGIRVPLDAIGRFSEREVRTVL